MEANASPARNSGPVSAASADRRGGCADRRAVDDQYRYGRHGPRPSRSSPSLAPARRWCASLSIARRRPRRFPYPRAELDAGFDVPIIGDFHYFGHKLLADHPACAEGACQIPDQSRQCRLQGKEGPAFRHDDRAAHPHDKPVRIGVNWGCARPGTADRADGRERQGGHAARSARGDA